VSCFYISIVVWMVEAQARRQDLTAGGAKYQEGPKTRRGATFKKYSIGYMQQPVVQT